MNIKKPNVEQRAQFGAVLSDAHQSYKKTLYNHALYKTHNMELSQDLVQTTFLKTLLYLQKGGKIDTMRSFLNRLLHDLIVDEYRKHKSTSLDNLLEKGFEVSVDFREQMINIFDGKEAILLIDSLPKKYQMIIRMRYLQDLSISEMALLTGLSQNTVAVQACRGLAQLKVLYTESHKKLYTCKLTPVL